MNNENKELISKNELYDIMYHYINPTLDECIAHGGDCVNLSRDGVFYWVLHSGVGARDRRIGACLFKNRWRIYNRYDADNYANIEIYSDKRVLFYVVSEFDDFDKAFMYGLYMKIKKYIEGDNIEEVNEMSNNKGLISKDKLQDIIYQFIKPELDVCAGMGGSWSIGFLADTFYYNLNSCVGNHNRYMGSRLCDNYWAIYTGDYKEEHVNIKIFNDHIEFIEDSEFNDFSNGFMHELYEKIKKFVEGDNTEEEDNNIMENITNDILKYDDKVKKTKNKLFISSPMSNVPPDSVRRLRNRIYHLVKIMIHDPDLELIDQYDVDESDVDFSGMNENQIRQYRLHRSLSMMKYANVIVFGDYWWTSPGCIEEYIEASLYMQGVLKIMTYDLRLLENHLYDSTSNQNTTRVIHKFEQNRVNQIDNLLLSISSIRKPLCLPDTYSPELKVTKLLCDLKSENQESDEYDNDNSETDDMNNNGDEESSIITKNDSHYTFDQYIKEHCEDVDRYNDYWYALLIHNKLLDIMENIMLDRFGDGNTEVKTAYRINKFGDFVAYTIFAPINHNKKYHVRTAIGLTKAYNSEWCASNSAILIYDIKDDKTSKPFEYVYLPSQEGPETDDRITNQVLVDYIGSAYISHSDRSMFSRINSEFKAFIKDRDDIVWKKDK